MFQIKVLDKALTFDEVFESWVGCKHNFQKIASFGL